MDSPPLSKACETSLMTPPQNFSVTGAWLEGQDPGARLFLDIGDIELESGELITNAKIAYQTWGVLNDD